MKLLHLSCLLALTVFAHAEAPKFELRDGDRVLLLGDALLERENTLGFLEARMHAAWPTTKFTVRNLSWAGDTPKGWSRASFDGPAKGYERLKGQIALVKPTVVFLGYGMAASLQEMTDRSGDIMLNRDTARYGEEPMTAARFKKELGELMTDIEKTGEKTRFVLMSPIRHEDLRKVRPGTVDPTKHNELIEAYSKGIEELAKERGARFVSLAQIPYYPHDNPPKTLNGIHLAEAGHHMLAKHNLTSDLGWTEGTKPSGTLEESMKSPLTAAIVRKNDLFFHRTRPANSTYIFGFRKGEQGRNAVEIPQFDPLVDKVDAEIDALKRGTKKTSSTETIPATGSTDITRNVAPSSSGSTDIAPNATPSSPKSAEIGHKPLPIPNFTMEDGYEITLWADTALVGKPVGMNWDAAGRLWVACSPVYPMIAPGAHPEDKVVVIEDTDRDGKADKSTTFATNLLIAAGVAPDFAMDGMDKMDGMDPAKRPSSPSTKSIPSTPNAAYVGSSTELVHVTDTDGDGKADARRVVLSGFGTEDTHHTIHTLKWGPDGRLYFNQSIYIHSHLETPYGMIRMNSAGILAYDPRTERTEVIAKGWCNPWGHVWDEWGQQFTTDGAGGQGISWLVPGAMYFTYENAKKIMPSVSPGSYPKFCGLELIKSPLFPADWQGDAITCDFRAHRIARFSFKDLSVDGMDKMDKVDGKGASIESIASKKSTSARKSGYETKAEPDLVRTTDNSFRPIDVKLGPDGALYVADWTNPVINHGEVDFRDPRRDHVNGRIWRIAPKGKAGLAWGSHSTALKAPLPKGRNPAEAAALIGDPNPRVRVEAMRALCKSPSAANAALVLEAAVNGAAAAALPAGPTGQFANSTAAADSDTHYAYAAWLSVNDLAPQVMEYVEKLAADPASAAKQQAAISFALQALPGDKTGPLLSKIIAKNGVPKDGSGPWIELIGQTGSAAECQPLLDALRAATTPDSDLPHPLADAKFLFTQKDANRRAAAALVAAARRGVKPADAAGNGWQFFHYAPAEAAADVARLAGLWKEKGVADSIAARLDATPAMRDAVFESLSTLGNEESATVLTAFLDSKRDPAAGSAFLRIALQKNDRDIRRRALAALAAFKPDAALAGLSAVAKDGDELALFRSLFASETFKGKFVKAVPADLPKPAAEAALRAARELGRKGEALVAALTPLVGAPAPASNTGDIAAMVTNVQKNGNPVEGEAIYRRLALACTACHAIGGAGGKVGPDMTTIGASAPIDYLIESLIVPNAKVKEGYNAVSLTLKGGRAASGVLLRETPDAVFLRDAAGNETSVPKADITARENVGSIMPAGLLNTLTDREKAHVFAFLAQLGKPGPFDATKASIARVWWLYPGKDVEAIVAGKVATPGAKTLTYVDGRLPKAALVEALQMVPDSGDTVVAVAKFAGAGKTRLNMQGVTKAWLDGAPLAIASNPSPEVELTAGNHTLVVKLDTKQLPEVLRADCPEGRFATE